MKYYQWLTNDKMQKVEIISSVLDAFDELSNQMKSFLVHVYVKRHQAASIQKLKSSANGIDVVLQVDFSENASLQN